jgi:predicted adenylyl cyclase CyaB
MAILNIEFKAKATDLSGLENILLQLNPVFIGEDHQIDTYFNVPVGRMKLREGNIENALIHYVRENTAGSKSSHIILYQHQPDENLKKILTAAVGVKTVVDKRRKIYFIDNVKFHFDTVDGLGNFVEVEAIDKDGSIGKEKLQQQCDHYANIFKLLPSQFVAVSYSDLLLQH